jgi:DNA-damage-inducible protein J
MANSLVSFREEESRKITATSICNEIGIDLPTYLRICISRLISEGGIPFSMKIDEQNKTLQLLKKASQRAEENGTSDMTLDEINNEISEARKNY